MVKFPMENGGVGNYILPFFVSSKKGKEYLEFVVEKTNEQYGTRLNYSWEKIGRYTQLVVQGRTVPAALAYMKDRIRFNGYKYGLAVESDGIMVAMEKPLEGLPLRDETY